MSDTEYIDAPLEEMHFLLKKTIEKKASDLIITPNSSPKFRIDGKLVSGEFSILSAERTSALLHSILSEAEFETLLNKHELDFTCGVSHVGRFRVNAYFQRGSIAAAFRPIPSHIPTLKELHLPQSLADLVDYPNGLVLLTGPTGCGKSTTLATLIEIINEKYNYHVITIEDPIEYIYKNKKSVIDQREVGADTDSFANALRNVVRQSPDVILVGEMRDLETISMAITAAETGHLVFSTLHTIDAAQSIHRIVDVFPSHQQQQIRVQLAGCLRAIASQCLLPKLDDEGRIPALEVMVVNSAIRSMITLNDIQQIPSVIQTGAKEGMKTLNQTLKELVEKKLISYDTAIIKSSSIQNFFGRFTID
ncbi:MAG: type IV pilus twitching motility protein PilT [Candidatus Firestonebacteria bacterium]